MVVVVVAAVAVTGWRVHWPAVLFGSAAPPPPLAWSAARAPLPADATKTASEDAFFNDVACPGINSCVAVGLYESGTDAATVHGLIETLSGGTWTPAVAPGTLPGAGQATYVTLDGIACQSMAECVAVGVYVDAHGNARPLAETRSGGSWKSSGPPLPPDADPSKTMLLNEVACPSAGTCVAGGWYTDQNGDSQGLIETLADGKWTAARAPVPLDAGPHKVSSSTLSTDLVAVRCPAAGTCVATGNYTDFGGATEAMIDTLADGTWTSVRAPLPPDAGADPVAFLWGLTCQAPGSCLAAGHYNDRKGQSRDLVATLSGGVWTPTATPLPADATASQKWNLGAATGLTAVACQSAGACAAEGSYFARGGRFEGVIASLSGGTWTAVRAPLPAGAAAASQVIFFSSTVCPAPGSCFAVGAYKAANGSTQGLIETAAPARG